jgi:hypothetical protein
MKRKATAITPAKASRLRKEIEKARAELYMWMTLDIDGNGTAMRASIQTMADTVGLPLEIFAPHYRVFMSLMAQERIKWLEAQLVPPSARH